MACLAIRANIFNGVPQLLLLTSVASHSIIHCFAGTAYVPGKAEATMFMDAPPRMNQSIDTVRLECDHWKPYLGWMDEPGGDEPPSTL